jgi:hypothetical protein
MLRRALVPLVLFAALCADPALSREQRAGFAAHYRPGLMDQVARRRGMPRVPCMVASPHYTLGSWVKVRSQKNGRSLNCRVTDVPQPYHRVRLQQRKIVVELDFKSATVLCNIRRSKQEPPHRCPVVLSPMSASK